MLTRRIFGAVLCLLVLFVPRGHALPPDNDHWIRVETPNFVLFSNADEELSRNASQQLEFFRAVLEGNSTGPEPVTTKVFLFKNWDSLAPYSRGSRGFVLTSGGYFHGGEDLNLIVVNLAHGEDSYPTIYHEYTHYSLRKRFRPIPLWLNEAIATYYSSIRIVEREIQIGLPIPAHIEWLSNNPVIPLPELFDMTTSSDGYEHGKKRGTFYAQSWALFHYLKHERQSDLNKFLARLAEGSTVDDAFSAVFGGTYDVLQGELTDYVAAGSYRYVSVEIRDLVTGLKSTVRSVPRHEILYELGELLVRDLSQSSQHQTSGARRALDDAEAHFRAVLDAEPNHALAQAGLGYTQDLRGDHEAAAELYEQAIALGYAEYLPYFRYGTCLLYHYLDEWPRLQTRVLTARGLFSRTIQQKPDLAAAYAGFGATYFGLAGDTSVGIRALQRALRAFPSRSDIAFNLLLLHLDSGDRGSATSLLSSNLRHAPNSPWLKRAEDALLGWDISEARELVRVEGLEAAQQGLEALGDSASVDLFQVRGALRLATGDREGALADFSRLIELKPRFGDAYGVRATIHDGMDNAPAALADYSMAVELRPRDAGHCNNLAWFLATCEREDLRDSRRAVQVAQTAVEIAPTSSAYWNTLGAARYRNNDFQASVIALQKSIQLSGQANAYDLLYLAMAHHQLAQPDSAREAYEKSLEVMGPEDAVLEPIRLLHEEAIRVLNTPIQIPELPEEP